MVESERWTRKCKVCGTDNGATLLCQHKKCDFAFHPECGKELLVNYKKFGLEETDCFCLSHRPIKLGKMIENRDKTKLEEIQEFVRLWEKWESKPSPQGAIRPKDVEETVWSPEETEQLEREILRFLHKANEKQKTPFELTINFKSISRSGLLSVLKPEAYNSLSPEAILTERICIRSRSSKECYHHFQSKLMARMRFELDLCRRPAKVFIPKKRRRLTINKKEVQGEDLLLKRPRKQYRHSPVAKTSVETCVSCNGAVKATLLYSGAKLCENCRSSVLKQLIS